MAPKDTGRQMFFYASVPSLRIIQQIIKFN